MERGAPQSLPLMESGKVRCVQIQLMNQEVKVEYMFTVYGSFFILNLSPDTARCQGDNRKSRDKRTAG